MEIYVFLVLCLCAITSGNPASCKTNEPEGSNVPSLVPVTSITDTAYTLVLVPTKPGQNTADGLCATEELGARIDDLERKISNLLLEISSKDFAIKDLQSVVSNLEEHLYKVNDIPFEQECDTAELKSKVTAQNGQIAELEKEINSTKSEIQAIRAKNTEQDTKLQELNLKLEAKSKASDANDTLRIGRWRIEQDNSTEALLFCDTQGEDKRYAFPVGGKSDMYTRGTGGEVHVSRLVFPNRWSIYEGISNYLVARDRGAARDSRYTFHAGVYKDL